MTLGQRLRRLDDRVFHVRSAERGPTLGLRLMTVSLALSLLVVLLRLL